MDLMKRFCEEYLEKIFYYCLKKTGNEEDAGDLSADISCEVAAALNRGTEPANFDGWVWKIAANRWKRWAKTRWYSPMSCHEDIDDLAGVLPDNEVNIENALVLSEDLGLMRRELAFIRSDYRNILVAHYFEEKSVSQIVKEFSLPPGTVKTKLQNSRKKLREGMNMAREFGKRSYNPEQVSFVMNGRSGEKGQPWSILPHLMYKNIFLEVYENPETAEELSLELGIALPYMEDELEFLVREELLKKSGSKYETNFRIISREEQRAEYDANKKIQKPLTDKLCELIDTYMNEGGAKFDVSYVGCDAAKWALIMRAFDGLKCEVEDRSLYGPYPSRPDDGEWVITGYETVDFDEPDFVGQHGWISRELKEAKFDIDFGQFKFYVGNHQAKTPEHLTYKEGEALWLTVNGRADEVKEEYAAAMLDYGYLKKNADGKAEPNVVVFDRRAEEKYSTDAGEKLTALKNEIIKLFKQAPSIERGYVVEQALADGWLKYSDDLIPTAGAYIYK